MRIRPFLSALLWAAGTAFTAWGADLSADPANANDRSDVTKIARTIDKEPAYQSKPKYCLLVFGPEAKTRVWLVLDGANVTPATSSNRTARRCTGACMSFFMRPTKAP